MWLQKKDVLVAVLAVALKDCVVLTSERFAVWLRQKDAQLQRNVNHKGGATTKIVGAAAWRIYTEEFSLLGFELACVL